tara:strand:+ start:5317 stop:6024 length:708 start_codon:yes stop_codon:yes gene_type:complete
MRLKEDHNAVFFSRTIHKKFVFDVAGYDNPVIKASSNKKLGKKVTNGRLKGAPIYTLTLEERATCSRDCEHWLDCYGNNMGFAHRFKAGADLEVRIIREISALAKKHPDGFLVRLHVLGDFYSVPYVNMWAELLERYPALNIYGYTRHNPDNHTDKSRAIGRAVAQTHEKYKLRFMVRMSNQPEDLFSANGEDLISEADAITCLSQNKDKEKRKTCAECGLCWAFTKKPIRFLTH